MTVQVLVKRDNAIKTSLDTFYEDEVTKLFSMVSGWGGTLCQFIGHKGR
jgi:hypothetical protein